MLFRVLYDLFLPEKASYKIPRHLVINIIRTQWCSGFYKIPLKLNLAIKAATAYLAPH